MSSLAIIVAVVDLFSGKRAPIDIDHPFRMAIIAIRYRNPTDSILERLLDPA